MNTAIMIYELLAIGKQFFAFFGEYIQVDYINTWWKLRNLHFAEYYNEWHFWIFIVWVFIAEVYAYKCDAILTWENSGWPLNVNQMYLGLTLTLLEGNLAHRGIYCLWCNDLKIIFSLAEIILGIFYFQTLNCAIFHVVIYWSCLFPPFPLAIYKISVNYKFK